MRGKMSARKNLETTQSLDDFKAGLLFANKLIEIVLESAEGKYGKAQQNAASRMLRQAEAIASFEKWRRAVNRITGGL